MRSDFSLNKVVTAEKRKTAYRRKITAVWHYRLFPPKKALPTITILFVCVFFQFIVDIKFVGRRGDTGFLIHLLSAVRALIFLARRIQPFLSLIDREVEFCVLTI